MCGERARSCERHNMRKRSRLNRPGEGQGFGHIHQCDDVVEIVQHRAVTVADAERKWRRHRADYNGTGPCPKRGAVIWDCIERPKRFCKPHPCACSSKSSNFGLSEPVTPTVPSGHYMLRSFHSSSAGAVYALGLVSPVSHAVSISPNLSPSSYVLNAHPA